jgi:outer membrane protein
MSLKLSLAGTASALALLLTVGTASAASPQAGDLLVRGGLTAVVPTNQPNSDEILLSDGTPTGSEAKVENGYALGLTLDYMITNNWSVELLLALPYFEHKIKGDGGALDDTDIAEIKMLPPSLIGQYHFQTGTNWTPYVGAGVTYFWVLDESNKLPAGLDNFDVDVSNAWGLTGQVGVDYFFNQNWMLNLSARYVWLETDAEVKGLTQKVDNVKINPVVLGLHVGYRF